MSVKQKPKDDCNFLEMFYRKSNNMNNMVFFSLKKSMNDSRAQAGPSNIGNS